MKRVLTTNAGIGLTEVLVAVAIFVSVIVGLGKSVLSARRATDSSRDLAEATTLAIDKIEHLRTLFLASSDLSPGTHTDAANPLGPGGVSGGTFTRTWSVADNVPVAGMRRVEMRIQWRERNRTGSVTLVSYLSLV